jgi:GWxTD domain-containing protein
MRHGFLFITILTVFFPWICDAKERPSNQQPSDPVVFQTVRFPVQPSQNPDSSRPSVYFLYRIDRSFFSVRRNESVSPDHFEIDGELLVEFIDEKTSFTSRRHRTIRETAAVAALQPESGNDFQGFFTFPLLPGNYTVVVELKDLASNRHFSKEAHVLIDAIPDDSLEIAAPLFVSGRTTPSSKDSFVLINRGTTIPFADSGGIVVRMEDRSANDSISISWTISPVSGDDTANAVRSGKAWRVLPSAYGIRQEHNVLSLCALDRTSVGSSIYIPLPLDKLDPSSYVLKLTAVRRGIEARREIALNVVWLNKPFSLSDRHIVIDALRHIATEEEMDRMSGSVGSKGWNVFLEFWKKRSPDTTRAFNPVMAEYYRRVDETIRRFSDENNSNGYRTDRGRILILFGIPSKSERKFRPKSDPLEIWTYNRLQKRFIFNDPERSGKYTLMTVEEF